ncbi:MAG: tRNA (guanosine(46)-N7)-methyltransferase TrmB [Deltaproteobacteria bacterium]|nr:tRNA (guanosine(46)-N7)-methyltransferase TrmB [Deltaproteobacteria bacterium]
MILQAPESVPVSAESDFEVRLARFEKGFSWNEVFGNARPVVLELGCGKGRFIIRSAGDNPDTNFFGIEKSQKYVRLINQRARRAGIANLRLLSTDGAYFVARYVPAASVQACHIFFPDPWPKKRHLRRRLVNSAMVEELQRILLPGGRLYYKTDFQDYYEQMLEVTRACPGFEELYSRTVTSAEADPEEADTHYERRYLIEGRPIYEAGYEKAGELLS